MNYKKVPRASPRQELFWGFTLVFGGLFLLWFFTASRELRLERDDQGQVRGEIRTFRLGVRHAPVIVENVSGAELQSLERHEDSRPYYVSRIALLSSNGPVFVANSYDNRHELYRRVIGEIEEFLSKPEERQLRVSLPWRRIMLFILLFVLAGGAIFRQGVTAILQKRASQVALEHED